MTHADRIIDRETQTMIGGSVMEYLSKQEYRRLKSALTRAINSGDQLKVVKACREAREVFNGKAWPDDWNRWANAHQDAVTELQREAYDW